MTGRCAAGTVARDMSNAQRHNPRRVEPTLGSVDGDHPSQPAREPPIHRRRRSWWPWIIGAVMAAAVVAFGVDLFANQSQSDFEASASITTTAPTSTATVASSPMAPVPSAQQARAAPVSSRQQPAAAVPPREPAPAAVHSRQASAPQRGDAALVNALAALHAHDYHAASNWAQRARDALGDTPAVAEVQASVRDALAKPRAAHTPAKPRVAHTPVVAQKSATPGAAGPSHREIADTSAAAPTASASATSTASASVNAAAVQELVARATTAAQAGDIASPPGRSAYDLYMQALELDGTNAAANAGLRSLPDTASSRFRTDVTVGDLDGAARMLTAVQEISPASAILPGMRQALREAWVERAAHYTRIGEPDAAQRASAKAQQIGSD